MLTLTVLAVVAGATARLLVWPPVSPTLGPVDAVIVFSGGRGERLAQALTLMDRGLAPVLVISNGTDARWPAANRLCSGATSGYVVHCPVPAPDNTRGEARTIASLASREGWDELVLVTSTYHALRAGVVLRRCHHGRVSVVAARPRQSAVRTWLYAGREWLALAGTAVDRDC
jgi:uncharacterized SAM-binding protein YcdF (DUF218 family)